MRTYTPLIEVAAEVEVVIIQGGTLRRYHECTKHSRASVLRGPHGLDWEIRPLPFKIYRRPCGEALALPDPGVPEMPALEAVGATATGEAGDGEQIPDIAALAQLLFYSGGVTRRVRYPGGEVYYRAAACTGALYHIDLYIVACDLPGLEAGVYHFGPHDWRLRRLRRGDYRAVLVEATGEEPAIATAPVVVVCASTYWRNAWKYRERAYRHCFWDCGTLLANLLAVAAAQRMPTRVVVGFVDRLVERLLGLDPGREGVIALVPVGYTARATAEKPPVAPLACETVALSPREVDYPLIREAHAASAFSDPAAVAAWRGSAPEPAAGRRCGGRVFPLVPASRGTPPGDSIGRVILRRGSVRRIAREGISFRALSTVLDRATRGVAGDYLPRAGAMVCQVYLIVNAVSGLPAGSYYFHRCRGALELLRAGDFRDAAGRLALDQELGADAAACIYFLADLDSVLGRCGERGYRVAQLEAGICGGKVYLAAYAQRLGATGLTFFDDEVTGFFSPHATGKGVMFLVAVGKEAGRRRGSPG